MNYYSRFIEDFAIYALVLYKLREADFHEIRRLDNSEDDHATNQDHDGDTQIDDEHGQKLVGGGDRPMTRMDGHDQPNIEGSNGQRTSGHRWEIAMIAFKMLTVKFAQTPVLRNFDPDRRPVIVVYTSKWAESAALLQEHDGVNWFVCS